MLIVVQPPYRRLGSQPPVINLYDVDPSETFATVKQMIHDHEV